MKKVLSTIQAILLTTVTFSQDTLSISKTTILDRVQEHNYQVRIAQKEADLARADMQQSRSLFLPSVSTSYTAITTNNPLMAFGSRLNQEVLTQADFDPATLNDPDNIENFATEILILQPLLNLDGIQGRNAARIQQEAMDLKAERTQEYIALEGARIYMQLQLAYSAVAVLERALRTALEGVKLVTDYYTEGLVQKADVLDARVRANEVGNQLRFARTHVQNTSDQLAAFIGEIPGEVTYKPAETIQQYEPATYLVALPQSRKDLLAMSKAVEGYESILSASKMQFLPRVNAFGSFQLYDDQFLSFGASGYILGAKLSWNLFNGYSHIAKANQARVRLEKAQIEQEEYTQNQKVELQKTHRLLENAKSKVNSSQLALEQAQEAYKIRKDRFEEGLEKTVDLLASESQMFLKELQHRQAIFELNFASEYLHFLTRS